MAIKGTVGGGGGNYDPAPQGNHVARVYRIIHIGTIMEAYMGENKLVNKVQIGFELPNETKVFKEGEEAKPISLTQEYTLSMHEKANLRGVITGIIGTALTDGEAEAFDIEDLMGKECMINIVHKTSASGNVYAKLQSASPIPKGLEVPDAVNSPVLLSYDNWNQKTFDALAQFTRDKMAGSAEYRKMTGVVEGVKREEEEINPHDIPF